MFVASYERTMRNARPKFVEPVDIVVRTIEQIRAEKRAVAMIEQRDRAAAWAAKLEERRVAAEREAQAQVDANAFREAPVKGKQPVREIIAQVAAFHGFPPEVILSQRRDRPAVAARYEAIRAVREIRPELSTTVIGKLFDRDHTSILHALGRLKCKPNPAAPGSQEH
jgi:chromosomal replication initiator protein